MVYHRKISTFIKEQNALAKLGIYQKLDLVKKPIINVTSNSVLTDEAKPVKS